MICKDCGLILPWDGSSDIKLCTICRKPLSTTANDVFRDGKFGICKEKREGQYRLATDIENTIANNEILLAEGGTGIGKSYGYLVPGVLSGRRMVIATAKKTLQNQLYDKDLPTLRTKMPYDRRIEDNDDTDSDDDVIESIDAETANKFNFINIKGKSNYLCPRLIEAALSKFPKEKRKALLTRLSQITSGVKYGYPRTWVERPDFMELSNLFSDLTLENCPEPTCKIACRPKPRNFNIIVTNHHVLAYQLRYGEKILGKFEVLVVDEAHHLEDAIRSAFTDTVNVNYFKKPLRFFREDADFREMVDELVGSPDQYISQLRGLQNTLNDIAARARDYMDHTSKVIDQDRLREAVSHILFQYIEDLKGAVEDFGSGTKRMLAAGDLSSYEKNHLMHGASKMFMTQCRVKNLLTIVEQLKAPDPERKYVLLYEERNNENFLIRTPIEVGPLVQAAMENIPTKVFVSATLAVNKKFDYFKKRIGLDLPPRPKIVITRPSGEILAGKEKVIVENFYESPFDYRVQARLYTPHHTYDEPIPNPSDANKREEWFSAISKEILRLCRYADGDAFVLFTARTDLKEIASRTSRYFDEYGLNLLVQQDEGAEELLDRYRETPKSVLFGLKSFWEGIDIVGEKLRLVIIPKLPFPNQSDAVIKELVKRAGDNWFQEVYVPKMIFDLRQGVGRLIRTTTDRGVIAILDTRIWTGTSNAESHAKKWEALEKKILSGKPYGPAGYGKMVVLSLGFENVIDNFNGAVNFLKESLTCVNGD